MKTSEYPVSANFRVFEGYDIQRTPKLIIAIVAVESQFGKDIRLYRWQLRKDKATGGEVWKVDLARMSVAKWNWEELAKKINELKAKYGIASSPSEESD